MYWRVTASRTAPVIIRLQKRFSRYLWLKCLRIHGVRVWPFMRASQAARQAG